MMPTGEQSREVTVMAAKKMFGPGEVDRLLNRMYDEFKLKIDLRVQDGQIVMQFSDHIEYVRMRSAGARKLAAQLLEKADEVDRLNRPGKPR